MTTELPKPWEETTLGEVCEVNPQGKEISSIPDGSDVSFVPMAAVSEDGELIEFRTRKAGEVRKGFPHFRDGDVLVAKITPSFENGKRWLANSLKNGVGFGSTEFHVLRPSGKVLPEWIYYTVSLPEFRNEGHQKMTGTAGQKRIPKAFLESYKISIPPLEAQRKIVKGLQKAERIVKIRGQANRLTNRIIQSVFLNMFGDPASNPLRFPIATLGELAVMSRYGPRFYNQPYSDSGVPILRTTDITAEGDLSLDKAPKLEVSLEDLERYQLRKGDVVISRSGSLGRCAVFDAEGVDCIPGAFLLHFRFGEKVLPEYVHHYVLSPAIQRSIHRMGRFVAQPNVNAKELKSLKVAVPPIDSQRRFVGIKTEFQHLKERQNESTEAVNEIFHSLMQQAFSGQLVT